MVLRMVPGCELPWKRTAQPEVIGRVPSPSSSASGAWCLARSRSGIGAACVRVHRMADDDQRLGFPEPSAVSAPNSCQRFAAAWCISAFGSMFSRPAITGHPLAGRREETGLDEVVRLYQQGWSARKLARRFGVSDHTIAAELRRAGVQVRSRARSNRRDRPRRASPKAGSEARAPHPQHVPH